MYVKLPGPKWTDLDQSGRKCYADVIQKKRSNNKYYILLLNII